MRAQNAHFVFVDDKLTEILNGPRSPVGFDSSVRTTRARLVRNDSELVVSESALIAAPCTFSIH